MGATNHGTQQITWQYFQEATGANWGRRTLDILPVGIYSGGYLTKISDTEVSMSTLVAEISDGSNQISVRTTTAASLSSTTLDSGTISSGTPYLVLRWSYVESTANYVEVHALATLTARRQYDLVIGKCVFSGSTLTGFDYSDRTFPRIQEQNLRVEATPDTEMYVRLRGGILNTGNAALKIGDQKVGPFAVPTGGNSRIDLVYITYDGTVAIQQGTPSPSPSAPSYLGKMVLAEVRVVNGDTNITWDRITDVRSFISHPTIIDETTLGINSSGRVYVIRDSIVPYWEVSVADSNTYTDPSQFVTTIATFRDPSFGSINKTHNGIKDYWMYNNSILFRMRVTAITPVVKTLKLFAVDNAMYTYIDSSLVYSWTTPYYSASVPKDVNLSLAAGNHIVEIVFRDYGVDAYLNLLGDIVDNTTVFFRAS